MRSKIRIFCCVNKANKGLFEMKMNKFNIRLFFRFGCQKLEFYFNFVVR